MLEALDAFLERLCATGRRRLAGSIESQRRGRGSRAELLYASVRCTKMYSKAMKAPDLVSVVKNLVHAADIGRSRSSIVNPLQWAIPILIAAMVVSVFGHPPSWLLPYFALLLGVDFAAFVGAFFYVLLTKPHLLRSESHDYKMSELNQSREMAEFIQKREKQMEEGLFDEVADANELKTKS